MTVAYNPRQINWQALEDMGQMISQRNQIDPRVQAMQQQFGPQSQASWALGTQVQRPNFLSRLFGR